MRKIKGLRWYMIALVTLGTVLGYLTRNTVAAAAPTLMEELHISTQQYSYIIAAYSAAYTVMQPVAGYVLDILGTKIGYAFFAIAWAVFCGSTALAGSWGGLALARGAVGAAEAAMIPAGLKASSEWFPAKERSIAVGYFNVGSSIGAMIAPPLVVWAIVMHSWQMAFIISGVLSFAWAIAWLIFYKHPRDQKKLSDEERDYIIGGQESQHQTNNAKKMSPWQILRNRQFWGIALPRFLAEPAWGTFNAWIPLFMFKVYGFNLKEIAMFAWMPMLFADLGCIVGGYLPPLFQRWFGVNLIVSRKMVVTMGALLMIGPGMIGLFTSPYVVLRCIYFPEGEETDGLHPLPKGRIPIRRAGRSAGLADHGTDGYGCGVSLPQGGRDLPRQNMGGMVRAGDSSGARTVEAGRSARADSESCRHGGALPLDGDRTGTTRRTDDSRLCGQGAERYEPS